MRSDAFYGCGDLCFSSHTIFVMVFTLIYTQYGDNRMLKYFMWLLVLGFGLLIIAARKHYSIDVVVAFYTVPLLWVVYDHFWPDEILPIKIDDSNPKVEFESLSTLSGQDPTSSSSSSSSSSQSSQAKRKGRIRTSSLELMGGSSSSSVAVLASVSISEGQMVIPKPINGNHHSRERERDRALEMMERENNSPRSPRRRVEPIVEESSLTGGNSPLIISVLVEDGAKPRED